MVKLLELIIILVMILLKVIIFKDILILLIPKYFTITVEVVYVLGSIF